MILHINTSLSSIPVAGMTKEIKIKKRNRTLDCIYPIL